jgi:hypothetical protein
VELLTKKTVNVPEWPIYSWLKSAWKIYGKTWTWLSSNNQQPIWQNMNIFENNKWEIAQSRCEQHWETYILTAVIAAKIVILTSNQIVCVIQQV